MLLTEAEGKALLADAGLPIPQGQVHTTEPDWTQFSLPVFLKAQTTFGNRSLQGLVQKADNAQEAATAFTKLSKNHPVLIEEAVSLKSEQYLSIQYDTHTRQPVALFSPAGGVGMDDRGATLEKVPLSVAQPTLETFAPAPALTGIVNQLFQVFLKNDAVLVEINPLAETETGFVCLDAKIELEDQAAFRHPEWETYGHRTSLERPLTAREEQAHRVSAMDHRGVAGESFFEFPGGKIGIMASGGGASAILMDEFIRQGLKPANYTEYSGNPVREKVKALAEVVLSLPDLEGLFVAGSNANFTDIYETLAGVVDGLLESEYVDQEGFVVLIRRGGPRWQEAFAMVEERLAGKPLKLKLFGPDFPLVDTVAEMKALITK